MVPGLARGPKTRRDEPWLAPPFACRSLVLRHHARRRHALDHRAALAGGALVGLGVGGVLVGRLAVLVGRAAGLLTGEAAERGWTDFDREGGGEALRGALGRLVEAIAR